MNIGIITYHRSVSYGAFLQTYALSRYLKGLGHDVNVIDYNPAHRGGKVRQWTKRFFGFHPQNIVNSFKYRCFSDHTERYLPLTERSYRTLRELQNDPPAMDAYICGSDQIWNPTKIGDGFDPAYFNCFGGSHIKRIAYAASIGSSHIPEKYNQALCDNVSWLDHLSAREKSACDWITSITGRQCAHVLDPTFLISDYSELYKPERIIKKPYVLVFSLQDSALFHEVLQTAKAAIGLPFVFVGRHYKLWKYRGKCRFCTPGDWLNLYANAKAVITNSFHGTVFSLKFEKPFISVGLTGKIRVRNIRMSELFDMVQLSERFVVEDTVAGNAKLITDNPDWINIEKCLSSMITHSVEFLSKSLAERD